MVPCAPKRRFPAIPSGTQHQSEDGSVQPPAPTPAIYPNGREPPAQLRGAHPAGRGDPDHRSERAPFTERQPARHPPDACCDPRHMSECAPLTAHRPQGRKASTRRPLQLLRFVRMHAAPRREAVRHPPQPSATPPICPNPWTRRRRKAARRPPVACRHPGNLSERARSPGNSLEPYSGKAPPRMALPPCAPPAKA